MSKSSKFRVQAHTLLLTYKHHLDKELMQETVEGWFDKTVEGLYIAHENGKDDPNTPYKHTHVAVKWASIVQSTKATKFDFKEDGYDDIHPNIKQVKGKNGWSDTVKYVTKEDTLSCIFDDTESRDGAIGRLSEYENLREAVKGELGKPEFKYNTTQIAEAWRILRESNAVEVDDEPEFWQSQLPGILEECNRRRDVIWIIGSNGGEGKSTWSRNRVIDSGAMYITSGTSSDNIFNRVRSHTEDEGKPMNLVIFDLPRMMEEQNSIYTTIENLKNGSGGTCKYKGWTGAWKRPNVVVFSNWFPDVKKLSLDRWKIFEIVRKYKDSSDEDGQLTLVPVSLNSLL